MKLWTFNINENLTNICTLKVLINFTSEEKQCSESTWNTIRAL